MHVEPFGLFIDSTYSYLAATPDGLIGTNAVVEVKCFYTGRQAEVSPGPMFLYLKFAGSGN